MKQLKRLFDAGTVQLFAAGIEDPLHKTPHALCQEHDGAYLYALHTNVNFTSYAVAVIGRRHQVVNVNKVDLKGVVYVAGPMRGIPKYNFPVFDDARDKLIALGYFVFNPADLDRAIGVNEDTTELPPFFIRDAMDRDSNVITKSSHIFLLPGWEESSGVRPEGVLADACGVRFLTESSPGGVFGVKEVPSVVVCSVIGGRLVAKYNQWAREQSVANN